MQTGPKGFPALQNTNRSHATDPRQGTPYRTPGTNRDGSCIARDGCTNEEVGSHPTERSSPVRAQDLDEVPGVHEGLPERPEVRVWVVAFPVKHVPVAVWQAERRGNPRVSGLLASGLSEEEASG